MRLTTRRQAKAKGRYQPKRLAGPGALAALGIGVLVGCGPAAVPEVEKPNVLLVVLDTVRADHTSTNGYERPTTIQISALAEVGVVFEDVTAPGSWTLPSHASLFTGEPPWVHGAHSVALSAVGPTIRREFFGMQVSAMREDLPTLAERFAAAGYRTVALSTNAWLGPEIGITRGFSEIVPVHGGAALASRAIETLEAETDQPLFLFLNIATAHSPYQEGPGVWAADPPEWLLPATAPEWMRPYLLPEFEANGEPTQFRGVQMSMPIGNDIMGAVATHHSGRLTIPPEGLRFLGRLYDAGVRGADFTFGRVLERWAARFPDSIVAVTSDHGEGFAEHGLLEHRASVYPEVLSVPLVIAAPGRLPPGGRIATPVALEEVYGALLELAGISDVGSSELLAIADGAPRKKPIAAAAWPVGAWARNIGGRYATEWRLYREGEEALVWSKDGDIELYRVDQDPKMLANLAPEMPERATELIERAKAHFASKKHAETKVLAISDELSEQLRALGYADVE